MEKIRDYLHLEQPFNLLEISTEGKTLTDLFLELNTRAQEEYIEHCYLSKKNYNLDMFRKTIFYRRYSFLKRHLNTLSYWLYPANHLMPKGLVEAMQKVPDYTNPWGVRVPVKHLSKNKLFEKDL